MHRSEDALNYSNYQGSGPGPSEVNSVTVGYYMKKVTESCSFLRLQI